MPHGQWNIYDDLIAAVPNDLVVSECLAGLRWFLVRSEGTGVAMKPLECDGGIRNAGHIAGMRTRELATWVKSWNWYEAALGLAAINSALNPPDVVQKNCESILASAANEDAFSYLMDDIRGKKVAVVGHFLNLERIAEVCDLSILERKPECGDLPDPACEYILHDQDVVIMTATTLINKTMPRLLELSRSARIVVAGPSTPLHPLMFDYGVDLLGGLVVNDQESVWRAVQEGGQRELFSHGSTMVKLRQTEVACEH